MGTGVDILPILESPELLAEQEQIVIGALEAIKNSCMWIGWSSFEDYCLERFGMDVSKIGHEENWRLCDPKLRERFPETGGIYFLQPTGRDVVKIGVAREFESRIAAIQCSVPERLIVLGVKFGCGFHHEKRLHRKLSASRLTGEWFMLSDEVRDVIEKEAVPLPRKSPGDLNWLDVHSTNVFRARRAFEKHAPVRNQAYANLIQLMEQLESEMVEYSTEIRSEWE